MTIISQKTYFFISLFDSYLMDKSIAYFAKKKRALKLGFVFTGLSILVIHIVVFFFTVIFKKNDIGSGFWYEFGFKKLKNIEIS